MYKGGTILALGDSITYGSQLSTTSQYGTYIEQTRKAILNSYGRCKVINKAISGWKSGDFLSVPYYWSRIEADLITLHIGTNDCSGSVSTSTFQTNLETIVDMLKHLNPKAEIVLCSISRRGDGYANSLDPYRAVVQTVASNKGTLLCKFEDAWTQGNTATNTAVDLLHPNTTGHTALFNQLWPVIQNTNFVKKLGK